MEDWLHGFGDVTESVKMSVDASSESSPYGYKSIRPRTRRPS